MVSRFKKKSLSVITLLLAASSWWYPKRFYVGKIQILEMLKFTGHFCFVPLTSFVFCHKEEYLKEKTDFYKEPLQSFSHNTTCFHFHNFTDPTKCRLHQFCFTWKVSCSVQFLVIHSDSVCKGPPSNMFSDVQHCRYPR